MGNTWRKTYDLVSTLLAIMASTILQSCTMPNDSKPVYITHFALNVVLANGSAHWSLADGGSEATLTDSLVILHRENFTLFSAKYDGSNLTQLYPGPLWGDHFPSPNGKKVLLASGFFEKSGYLVELYLMDPNGRSLVKLAPPKGWYAWPRISPDLDEIVFFRDGGIATINTDGTNFQYIRTKTDSTSCMFPLYVDESHILYFEDNSSGSLHGIRLFDKTRHEDQLVGSHSGGYPVYGRGVVGPNLLLVDNGTITVFNIFTSNVLRLGKGFDASFSSDGLEIVGSNGKTIFTMDSVGNNVHTIYSEMDSTKSIVFPQFSPDGKYVVFETLWEVRTS
jgi:Tol biopolymer transport system component